MSVVALVVVCFFNGFHVCQTIGKLTTSKELLWQKVELEEATATITITITISIPAGAIMATKQLVQKAKATKLAQLLKPKPKPSPSLKLKLKLYWLTLKFR